MPSNKTFFEWEKLFQNSYRLICNPIYNKHIEVKKMFKNLTIRLVNPEKKHLDLNFKIRQTDLAQRWANLIKKDLPYGIRESDRFTGFYEDPQTGIEKGIPKIISLIENLKPLHPEIDFGTVDFTDVQSEVNRIHVNFADRHLVRKDLTKKSFQYWNDLNFILHQMESYLYDMKESGSSNLLRADFTVTFYNQKKGTLTDKDYENAVLNQTFGVIYLNYAQVGRHIMELYWSKDEQLPLEHIQLFKKLGSDFFVYLGPSYGYNVHLTLISRVKEWFHKKEKYFSKVGLSWNPQSLCIGWLPVAQLEEIYHSIKEAKAFQRKVAQFQKVESITLN